jgi:hypothetical protein
VRIRAKVKHPFRVIKRQFGDVKVRYRGLAKNTAQLHTLFAMANLWMARRRLTGVEACMRPKRPALAQRSVWTTRNRPAKRPVTRQPRADHQIVKRWHACRRIAQSAPSLNRSHYCY